MRKPKKIRRASKVHNKLRRKKCRSEKHLTDLASTATGSIAMSSGTLLDLGEAQTSSASTIAGMTPEPKVGELERAVKQIAAAEKSGNIDVRAAAFKLRLPSVEKHRAEAFGFVHGAMTIINAINKGLKRPLDIPISTIVELATELYPDYDPGPAPTKRAEDGRRPDGIVMEK